MNWKRRKKKQQKKKKNTFLWTFFFFFFLYSKCWSSSWYFLQLNLIFYIHQWVSLLLYIISNDNNIYVSRIISPSLSYLNNSVNCFHSVPLIHITCYNNKRFKLNNSLKVTWLFFSSQSSYKHCYTTKNVFIILCQKHHHFHREMFFFCPSNFFITLPW